MALLVTDIQTGITTDADSGAVKTLYETMYLVLDVTTGTAGTLDVEVEWSADGNTFFSHSTPDTFAQVIATTGQTWLSAVTGKAAFFRLKYNVLTGPYSFTISAVGF